MKLVDRHVIKKSHKFYKECDDLCFKSKNLFNAANYVVRQEFIKNKKYINKYDIQKTFQGKSVDYLALPAKVSQQTLKLLDQSWSSFFAAIKDYSKNPGKYLGKPKLPNYKHKLKGRFATVYDKQAISKSYFDKHGLLKLSQTNIAINSRFSFYDVKQIRIVPRMEHYVIEVVHEVDVSEVQRNPNNVLGLDLGVNNLCAAASNDNNVKFLISGRPVKAINQFFNKKRAKLQSMLTKGVTKTTKLTSKSINKLTNKRNNKINDYLHKASRKIIDNCLTNDIGKIVIGRNKDWKQNIQIGKRNNQNFVGIPFYKLINMITYKAQLENIEVVTNEESYTSKCSALDNEKLCKHDKYLGRRVKRGLFKTKDKILVNSDINGALNIIRKVVSNFAIATDEIEGFAVSPKLLKV